MEVTGFASSDLSRGRANGVAVPDVDIVPRFAESTAGNVAIRRFSMAVLEGEQT